MRILVTDGDNRAALAVTRSLGRRGHTVIVGDRRARSLSSSSRHCHEAFAYPDPVQEEARFLDVLERVTRERRVDVLLPVSDITTMAIAAHRERWEPSCAVPFAPLAALQRAADKLDTLRTAERLQVPVPRSWVMESAEAALPGGLEFPVVLKPRQSRVRTPQGWKSCSVRFARSVADLRTELARRPAHEFPIILQERITGEGLGVFMCYADGRPVAEFSHRRLREKPPSGGVSVLSESMAMRADARAYAERLFVELGWRGVGMVEFKFDPRDGQPKLMEINGRFWGSLQLAIDAGVDFPALLVETASGAGPAVPPAYRIGVKNRWLWGDIDSLLLRLRRRSSSRFLAERQGRLSALFDFMHLWGGDLHYENPRLSDIGPWLYETRQRFRRAE